MALLRLVFRKSEQSLARRGGQKRGLQARGCLAAGYKGTNEALVDRAIRFTREEADYHQQPRPRRSDSDGEDSGTRGHQTEQSKCALESALYGMKRPS